MDRETELRLLELNRQFYDDFAEAFAESRGATEPGLERLVAKIRPDTRVLDLGCGQARLAHMLPRSCTYVGVDGSREMLRVASVRAGADAPVPADAGTAAVARRITFIAADLVRDPWDSSIGELVDWVVIRAVLHHIPGYSNRRDVLRRATGCLAPGGRIVVANWQFLRLERLRRRILPWSTVGLTDEDVDPGDFLLAWSRDGVGTRYAHLVGEAETRQLAAEAGLDVAELYYADGQTQDLTLYAVLE